MIPICPARTIFWPDDECLDVECMKPEGHDGPHEDDVMGEWNDD